MSRDDKKDHFVYTSEMKYINVFDLVSSEFKKAEIQFVLVGGYAVNCYIKESRQTMDIDFLINENDVELATRVLEKCGYKKGHHTDFFVRFDSSDLQLMGIDLLLADSQTFDGMYKNGKRVKISGEQFVIPSLNHLLAMKMHTVKGSEESRFFKDLPDIVNLIKSNGVKVDSEEFRNLCLKFGTRDLYEKIKILFDKE